MPFCTQSLKPTNIVPVTQNYWPGIALCVIRLRRSAAIESGISDRVSASVTQTLLQNVNNAEFWIQYCNSPPRF